MNLKLIRFLLFFSMNGFNLEDLIGKNIREVNNILDCDFKNELIDESFYYSNLKGERFYYNFISLILNEELKVESITIHFKKVIDTNFYYSFTKDYGKPENILIQKNKILVSESSTNEDTSKTFQQKLKQYESIVVEGGFKDKPKYVLWKKEHFEIRISIDYDMSVSEVTFKKTQ